MPKSKLIREEWSDELAEGVLKDFSEMQDAILLIIAERLEKLSEMSQEEAKALSVSAAAARYINEDMSRIKRAINKQDRKYAPRIVQMFSEIEKENFEYAKKYFEYRNIQLETIQKRTQTKELITAMQKQTVDNLLNLSHTYAYAYEGKVEPIGKTYRKIVNKAVTDASIGARTFQKTMRNAINQLSESGIKTLEWQHDTGKTVVRRADSHIRMNIKEGINRLNAELQTENGKLFGADGVETSMHSLCAPDHQPYQGRQFTNADWDKINNNLKRPWGTLNCHHFATPIIMGVSEPIHTAAERQAAIDRSNATVKYNDKEMTRYEASQTMRSMERDIRKYRSKKKAFEAAGDAESASKANAEIRTRLAAYKGFCEQVDLKPNIKRTQFFI